MQRKNFGQRHTPLLQCKTSKEKYIKQYQNIFFHVRIGEGGTGWAEMGSIHTCQWDNF